MNEDHIKVFAAYAADRSNTTLRNEVLNLYFALIITVALKVKKFAHHLELDELRSLGTIGAIKAIEEYDLSNSYSLCTAVYSRAWWTMLRGAFPDRVHLQTAVRQFQKRLALTLLKSKHRPTDADLAKELGMSESDFVELMRYYFPASLTPDVDYREAALVADNFVNEAYDRHFRNDLVEVVRRRMSQSDSELIEDLFFSETTTIEDVAEKRGYTIERIRQFKDAAIDKLKVILDCEIWDWGPDLLM